MVNKYSVTALTAWITGFATILAVGCLTIGYLVDPTTCKGYSLSNLEVFSVGYILLGLCTASLYALGSESERDVFVHQSESDWYSIFDKLFMFSICLIPVTYSINAMIVFRDVGVECLTNHPIYFFGYGLETCCYAVIPVLVRWRATDGRFWTAIECRYYAAAIGILDRFFQLFTGRVENIKSKKTRQSKRQSPSNPNTREIALD